MQDEIPRRLDRILDTELGLYTSLRLLTSRALEAILLDDDMEKLLVVLNEKQRILDELLTLVRSWQELLLPLGIDSLRGSQEFWDALSPYLPKESLPRLQAKCSEISTNAEALMRSEAEAQAALTKRLEELRSQMNALSEGRRAVVGYSKMGGFS